MPTIPTKKLSILGSILVLGVAGYFVARNHVKTSVVVTPKAVVSAEPIIQFYQVMLQKHLQYYPEVPKSELVSIIESQLPVFKVPSNTLQKITEKEIKLHNPYPAVTPELLKRVFQKDAKIGTLFPAIKAYVSPVPYVVIETRTNALFQAVRNQESREAQKEYLAQKAVELRYLSALDPSFAGRLKNIVGEPLVVRPTE